MNPRTRDYDSPALPLIYPARGEREYKSRRPFLNLPPPAALACKAWLYICKAPTYITAMLGSFKHRGLREFFETGRWARVPAAFRKRFGFRLDALAAARVWAKLRHPGFGLPPPQGNPQRYAIHVNGPWRITFEWDDGKALRVDLEQYH